MGGYLYCITLAKEYNKRMNLSIKSTNMEMTDAIRDYIYKRLDGLEKLAGNPESELQVGVEVGKTTNHHKSGDIFRAEVNMSMDGKALYASSELEDLYAAVDAVRDQIVREIKHVKDRKRSSVREGGQKAKAFIKGFFKK
jgi:putative sigma-54 modulation protein